MEYTITSLMNDTPKLWKGPYGDVYYHTVFVGGWGKPISVGKKVAGSVKVGDVLFGEINETDGPEDKFKAMQRPEGSTASESSVVAPKSDNKFLKDVSSLPLDVYRVRANINGLPTNETERAVFFENVKEDADELLRLIEEVRSDS